MPTLAVTAPIDEASLLVIVGVAALAAVATMLLAPRLTIPVVVLELLLGIIVGPEVAGIAEVDPTTDFLGDLGLGMLFFFAGYEIDFNRIRGRPLELALVGWGISLVLAYGIGGALAAAGVVLSYLYTGSAMATTAIGTLIPILRDAGELRTRFGSYLLAAGAVGEFGPILLITLILSTDEPAARGAGPGPLRRAGGGHGGGGGALGVEGMAAGRARLRDVEPARRPPRRRPGLRPGGARRRARARPAAGRLRRRDDHPGGAAGAGGRASSTRS